MEQTLNILSPDAHAAQQVGIVLQMPNDADPLEALIDGVDRIELNFPKFSDGRAFSQARLLRVRRGFKGDIRATGDVLIDQLVQMQRTGFSSAVLRADQDIAFARRQFDRYPAYYQGDVAQQPQFKEGRLMSAVDLHARASKDFEAKLAETRALLQRAAVEFAPVTQASSLGAEDVVITHLINALELDIPVFVLDTGVLHAPTLELLDRTRAGSRAPVSVYQPVNESVIQFVGREGTEAMYRSIELRKACCHIRKIEPLQRALAGKKAWITGLRREQSNARAEVPLIDESEPRIKLNPLANWTWGDVWFYIKSYGVDYNPLHDEFYPSIGCAPCTRAISLGEDFRAGRWWWEDEAAKECGLHVKKTEGVAA